VYTSELVEKLAGKPVLVFAPEYDNVPQWDSHLRVVTLGEFSPTQPDVVRTSGGPLQYTRRYLKLIDVSTDPTPVDLNREHPLPAKLQWARTRTKQWTTRERY
jgi:hypothetical protein